MPSVQLTLPPNIQCNIAFTASVAIQCEGTVDAELCFRVGAPCSLQVGPCFGPMPVTCPMTVPIDLVVTCPTSPTPHTVSICVDLTVGGAVVATDCVNAQVVC